MARIKSGVFAYQQPFDSEAPPARPITMREISAANPNSIADPYGGRLPNPRMGPYKDKDGMDAIRPIDPREED